MEDFKALKIFLFSIINLLTYLLSIYLYTSLYTKSKIGYSSNFEEILNSHSKQVRISFGFHTVSFIFFIISLFIIIYRSDLSSESSNENLQNGNIQNENIQNNNLQNGNIQNESITNENCIIIKYNDNAFLILFGLCQLFYLLNLLFISISLGRINAKKLENIYDEEKIINDFLKRISIELVVVSYIFFFILLFLFIWALLITDKKFNCLPYIKSKFQSLEDYLKNKIEDTPEKLQNKIRILDKGLNKLRIRNENDLDTISEIRPIVHH